MENGKHWLKRWLVVPIRRPLSVGLFLATILWANAHCTGNVSNLGESRGITDITRMLSVNVLRIINVLHVKVCDVFVGFVMSMKNDMFCLISSALLLFGLTSLVDMPDYIYFRDLPVQRSQLVSACYGGTTYHFFMSICC